MSQRKVGSPRQVDVRFAVIVPPTNPTSCDNFHVTSLETKDFTEERLRQAPPHDELCAGEVVTETIGPVSFFHVKNG